MSHKIDRTGEKRILSNGLAAEIIAYRNNKDIDVLFSDGQTSYVGKHLTYNHFIKGDISGKKTNKHTAQATCVGQEKLMNCGLSARITKYIDSKHIEVTFEDGIVVAARFSAFQNSSIKHPGRSINYKQIQEAKEYWLHQTRIATNGQHIKCIDYQDSKHLTVQFEDGTIVPNIHSANFKKGRVQNPNLTATQARHNRHKGETQINTQGCHMTLLHYNGWDDITVQFDDGTIVTSTYGQFKVGKIENPNSPRIRIQDHTGERLMCTNGLWATIIGYRNANDITIEFEDHVVINTRYYALSKGNVAHPELTVSGRSIYQGFKAQYVAQQADAVIYACECTTCGLQALLTPQQMIAHRCGHQSST